MSPTTKITEQRVVRIHRGSGNVDWQVNEFNGGSSFLLTASTSVSTQASFHFDRDQWAAFQEMVKP